MARVLGWAALVLACMAGASACVERKVVPNPDCKGASCPASHVGEDGGEGSTSREPDAAWGQSSNLHAGAGAQPPGVPDAGGAGKPPSAAQADAGAAAPTARICHFDAQPLLGDPTAADTSVVATARARLLDSHATGLAFVDFEGRVFSLPRGAEQATMVWEPDPADANRAVLDIATDGEAVYWASAGPIPPLSEPGTLMPPGRIERVAIDGTGHQVLLDDAKAVPLELFVDDERLVFTMTSAGGLNVMPKLGGPIDALIPAPFFGHNLAHGGEYFYWTDARGLHRVHDRSGEVEDLAPMQEPLTQFDDLVAGDAFVLLVIPQPSRPEGAIDQSLVRFDVETRCMHVFTLEQKGVVSPLLRGEEVLWKGYAHNTVSSGQPGPDSLWRMDLTTGESSRIEPDGVDMTAADLLGGDGSSVYVRGDDGLVRITP